MHTATHRAVERYLRDRRTSAALSRSTLADHGYILHGFAEHCPNDPHRINRRHVRRWLEAQTCAPSTLRTRLSAVRTFCDWLVAEEILTRSPVRAMNLRVRTERRRIPRAFSTEDAGQLYAVLPDARADCIVTLGLQLGLRCAEIAGLEVHDIDWTRREVHVRAAKGGKERVIPLTTDAARAISTHLAEHPASDGPLIRSYLHPHRGVGSSYISHLVTAWMREAGLKRAAYDGRSLHALRHTALSDMLDASRDLADVADVADVADHAPITTTRDLYTHRAHTDVLRPVMEGRDYRNGSSETGAVTDRGQPRRHGQPTQGPLPATDRAGLHNNGRHTVDNHAWAERPNLRSKSTQQVAHRSLTGNSRNTASTGGAT